eukprot:Nk52_evm30s2356 gene=Nk52_evmTU30s2356
MGKKGISRGREFIEPGLIPRMRDIVKMNAGLSLDIPLEEMQAAESGKVPKLYGIDIADALQQEYKLYARKNRTAFRRSVHRAMMLLNREKTALKRKGSDEDESASELDSDNDNDSVAIDDIDPHACNENNEMEKRDVYSQSSSDEENEGDKKKRGKKRRDSASTTASSVCGDSSLASSTPANVTVANTNMLNSSLMRNYAQQSSAVAEEGEMRKTGKVETANLAPVVEKKRSRIVSKSPSASSRDGEKPPAKKMRRERNGGGNGKRAGGFDDEYSDKYIPTAGYKDLGGIENCLQDIRELIEYPLSHPEIYTHLGVEPPRGILLHGPPGCGKTLLANAIAGEMGVPFLKIAAPEVVSGMSGESEAKVRHLFKEAAELAPCLIFIDEIDAITPKRETAQREMERRIVAQLLTCMDEIALDKTDGKPVIVIGATNRPDSLDSALRRAGRFDREICMGIPDCKAREGILRVLCEKLRLEGDFNYHELAKDCPGYVGADLMALCKEAAVLAVNRIFGELYKRDEVVSEQGKENTSGSKQSVVDRGHVSDTLKSFSEPLTEEQLLPLAISLDDFENALKKVQPSSKREGFTMSPNVTWEDVGALEEIRHELKITITAPIKKPELFESVGLTSPTGVLLYGPPGCGKTLLAKAVANECSANFISVKGPELLNKYVGESERAIRQVFERARNSSPCIIFFDEIDSLCPKRSSSSGESHASERVVNQLLTEMDGLDGRKQVFVVAATNRPDIIDPAMLRPGRLDKLLFVPLPSSNGRYSILKTLLRNTPCAHLDIREIADDKRCEGFTGADLSSLVREASVCAVSEKLLDESAMMSDSKLFVEDRHFQYAFSKVMPSVSAKDESRYLSLQASLRKVRTVDEKSVLDRKKNLLPIKAPELPSKESSDNEHSK